MRRLPFKPIFLFPFVILIATFLWPVPVGSSLTVSAVRALGLLCFTIVLWASEILDPAVTSLIVFLLLPIMGILPLADTASTLGTETVWQLILIYMVTEAISRSHLHRRFSYRLLLFSAGNTKLLSASFVVITICFTLFVPVPVGKVALVMPLIKETLEALDISQDCNLSRLVYFITGSIGLFSGVGIITGCPTNLYSAELMKQELSISWSYGPWLVSFMPIVIMATIVSWLLLMVAMPPEKPPQTGKALKLFIEQKLADLGPLSLSEKKLGLIVTIMISLWATGGKLHSLTVTQTCLLAAITICLPGADLVTFKEAATGISWSVMLVFAAGLALTRGLMATGAAAWLGNLISRLFINLSPVAAGVAIYLFLVIIRTAFTTPTAYAAALLPVAFAAGPNLGLNPLWLGSLTTIAAHTAFLYPMQSMTLMTAYNASSLRAKDIFIAGIITTVVTTFLTLMFAYYYWPHIGITPFL